MKKLNFLILFIFISLISLSQENTVAIKAIPKNASVIYVKPVSFDSILSKLKIVGFTIKNLVKNSIVETKFKRLESGINTISLHIRYYDSTAEIIGTLYSYDDQNGRTDPLVKNSLLSKNAFNQMNAFALMLNGNITYEK